LTSKCNLHSQPPTLYILLLKKGENNMYKRGTRPKSSEKISGQPNTKATLKKE